MRGQKGIYVETFIRGDMDTVWALTQEPGRHQRWDLRFTDIEYLPRPDESEPQRFFYGTRIGFGLQIRGEGESTGERDLPGGARSSALKFWSADALSLIRFGSGYWKYIPVAGGIQFLTWYDYETRWGMAGRLLDRVCFRPLIGWATSWSFDSLRLWIERGVPPELSRGYSLIHAICRWTIAGVWAWHGMAPKILWPSSDEIAMLAAAGVSSVYLPWVGIAEVILAVVTIGTWRWRGFFLLNAAAMLVALVTVALQSPAYLVAAFNPVSLNGSVIALSLIGYLSSTQSPFAGRCLRRPR